MQYQLTTKHTNCILVHRRTEADKATGQAELHRVSTMLAAGWSGLGTVNPVPCSMSFDLDVCLSVAPDMSFEDNDLEVCELSDQSPAQSEPGTLEGLAKAVGEFLIDGGRPQDLAAHCASQPLHTDIQLAIEQAVATGLSANNAWLLLAHWINTREGGSAHAPLTTLLRSLLLAVDPALVAAGTAVFERLLGRPCRWPTTVAPREAATRDARALTRRLQYPRYEFPRAGVGALGAPCTLLPGEASLMVNSYTKAFTMAAAKTVSVSFRVSPTFKALLGVAAARESRSLTNMLGTLVFAHCQQHGFSAPPAN